LQWLKGMIERGLAATEAMWPSIGRAFGWVHRAAHFHAFGSHRYHERRASGRKGASPALVLRGSVRMVAALTTRQREVPVAELSSADRIAWRRVRAELEQRRQRRVQRRQFRRDPHSYLKALENKLHQSRLPA
jgi:hypothetical protein